MTFFLVIDHKFRISPLFSLFQYIFPLFRENYSFPPTFTNFPPVLDKFTCFLHALSVFRFPPTLTMMHLCITQCTYWTPLAENMLKQLLRFKGSSNYDVHKRIRVLTPLPCPHA